MKEFPLISSAEKGGRLSMFIGVHVEILVKC